MDKVMLSDQDGGMREVELNPRESLSILNDVVYCCFVHKGTPSIVLKGDSDLISLGVKVLYYCPIPGCRSFRFDDSMETWENLYARFNINPLSYVVLTGEQRALQHFLRYLVNTMVRVAVLTDKEKRQAVAK